MRTQSCSVKADQFNVSLCRQYHRCPIGHGIFLVQERRDYFLLHAFIDTRLNLHLSTQSVFVMSAIVHIFAFSCVFASTCELMAYIVYIASSLLS